MHKSLIILNEIFSNKIIKNCKDKKVLLTLSGGLDTRAILSVLCRYDIHCDAITCVGVRGDIEISQKIAKHIKCIDKHILLNYSGWDEVRDQIYPDYDVVLCGVGMSEVFSKYEHMELSEKQLDKLIDNALQSNVTSKKKEPNFFAPVDDSDVRIALGDIPIMYRYFHYPQRCIVLLNYPFLMRFPYTTFNLRLRIVRIVYWNMIGSLGRIIK